MRVYIDLSSLLSLNYLSGIQRVAREITLRCIRDQKFDVILLNGPGNLGDFVQIDNGWFLEHYGAGLTDPVPASAASANSGPSASALALDQIHEKALCTETGRISLDDMRPGDIFFDVDSAWNLNARRSRLLPLLKDRGLRIVFYLHDLIPIQHPHYCIPATVLNFLNFLGAQLIYADLCITSVQSSLDALNELALSLGLREIPGAISRLGSDFFSQTDSSEASASSEIQEEYSHADPRAVQAALSGPFLLTVGTIEPRKNHKVLLDAFDAGLFESGLHLIFAGRMGWNVEDLKRRINSHKDLGSKLFYFDNLDDASIDYLYRKAMFMVFPTYNEGFGIPIVEAFERRCPVLASDIPVLREVGGDLALYFPPDDKEALAKLVNQYLNDEKAYKKLRKKLEAFEPFTWDQTAEIVEEALLSLNASHLKEIQSPKQIVYIPDRLDDPSDLRELFETLKFTEHDLPFISKALLCCPEDMADRFQRGYQGKLPVDLVIDKERYPDLKQRKPASQELSCKEGEILCDISCMEGGTSCDINCMEGPTRLSLLLSSLVKSGRTESAFLLTEGKDRPLQAVSPERYSQNGRYIGYYFSDIDLWEKYSGDDSPFGLSQKRTALFLRENRLPGRLYASHMPQLIDSAVFQEMLEEFPTLPALGVDLITVYFNWLCCRYPGEFLSKPYLTIGWPKSAEDYRLHVAPTDYLFEHDGDASDQRKRKGSTDIAEKGERTKMTDNPYQGIGGTHSDPAIADMEIEREREISFQKALHHVKLDASFGAYRSIYTWIYREEPSFAIRIEKDQVFLSIPKFLLLPRREAIWIHPTVSASPDLLDRSENKHRKTVPASSDQESEKGSDKDYEDDFDGGSGESIAAAFDQTSDESRVRDEAYFEAFFVTLPDMMPLEPQVEVHRAFLIQSGPFPIQIPGIDAREQLYLAVRVSTDWDTVIRYCLILPQEAL